MPRRISIFHPPSSILYPPRVRWKKISIIGVGLLGGSIGLAAKKRRLASEVAGYVRRSTSIADCEKFRATDYATTDLLAAVSGADLVILCTPLAQMRSLVMQLLPALKRGAIVTDVGSVKASVVRDIETLIANAGAHLVGSHPMAGGEKTGVAAARADLFENAVCVLTPTRNSNREAVRKLEQFWKMLGSRVMKMSPQQHDLVVSRTSHLPHFIAATLASYVLDPRHSELPAALCANGFRDSTRIASGSPEMWRDIASANREQLRVALDEFVRELQKLQALLRGGKLAPARRLKGESLAKLERFLATAKQRRDNWCACSASPSPE